MKPRPLCLVVVETRPSSGCTYKRILTLAKASTPVALSATDNHDGSHEHPMERDLSVAKI